MALSGYGSASFPTWNGPRGVAREYDGSAAEPPFARVGADSIEIPLWRTLRVLKLLPVCPAAACNRYPRARFASWASHWIWEPAAAAWTWVPRRCAWPAWKPGSRLLGTALQTAAISRWRFRRRRLPARAMGIIWSRLRRFARAPRKRCWRRWR